jgi:hypothetical protein
MNSIVYLQFSIDPIVSRMEIQKHSSSISYTYSLVGIYSGKFWALVFLACTLLGLALYFLASFGIIWVMLIKWQIYQHYKKQFSLFLSKDG